MANLIIKPTSGGSLILQDEGGTAAHTIDASGNHTLSGSTNNLGTVTAGTIANSVTYPSGFQVGGTILSNSSHTSSHISSSSTNTWVNSGLSGSYAPVKSSSETYLKVHFHAGMQQYGTAIMITECTMNDSDDTSFAVGDAMGAYAGYGSGAVYSNRQSGSANETSTFHFLHNAVATGGMAVNRPDSLTTYAAGTTYYFRMYWSCDSGTSYFLHTDSYYLFWLEEVMR